MPRSNFSLQQLLVLMLTTAAGSEIPASSISYSNGKLSFDFEADTGCTAYPCKIFEDNFDFLDFKKWQHVIRIDNNHNVNNNFEYYHNSRRNSFTRDGKLFIRPTLTELYEGQGFVENGKLDLWGEYPSTMCTGNAGSSCERQAGGGKIIPPVQSARLRSVHSFNFRYGRIEVEAKMPNGDWLWPAIWMMPESHEYGDWPASGEIDLVEACGNRNLRARDGSSVGVDQAGMTVHWGPKVLLDGSSKAHVTKNLKGGRTFGNSFHKYQMEWGPDIGLVFSIDGERLMTVNPPEGFWKFGEEFWVDGHGKPLDPKDWNPWKPEFGATRLAPFDKPFFIIMNVAVGGTRFFSDDLVNLPYPKPWNNTDSNAIRTFYKAKHLWYPTWKAENFSDSMQVNYVRVWKTKPDP